MLLSSMLIGARCDEIVNTDRQATKFALSVGHPKAKLR